VPGRRRFLAALATAPLLTLACGRDAEPATLKAGDPMPLAELPTLDGKSARLEPGAAPFLVNFWATWCLPCRQEMQSLERVHVALGARGLRVVGISIDTDEFLVHEYVLHERLTFPILLDRGPLPARRDFMVRAYPSSFLVDRAGRVAEIWVGSRDWDDPALRQRLERVL